MSSRSTGKHGGAADESKHDPVLLNEVIDLLGVKPGGMYVDGTVGGCGHAMAILEAAGMKASFLGIDRDASAAAAAGRKLAGHADCVKVMCGNYAAMGEFAAACGFASVDGVLLDLGISSDQLGNPDRGFSFGSDGPLDMRMDQGQALDAEKVVNEFSEDELISCLFELGEERKARRIARGIVAAREMERIRSTGRLAEIVAGAAGGRRGARHPATKTFQAIRMKVNDELGSLDRGLVAGLGLLKAGGRMAVITFHSLEDRMVKTFFARHAGRWESLQQGGSEWIGEQPAVKLVNRKPVSPSDDEIVKNRRARSAKLRVAERI